MFQGIINMETVTELSPLPFLIWSRLTLLHSERPKLHRVLAVLSAKRVKESYTIYACTWQNVHLPL